MSKMISFLQNLILIIAFMTNIKNKDVAVVIFGIPFLAIPIVIIQIIWKKIFHR